VVKVNQDTLLRELSMLLSKQNPKGVTTLNPYMPADLQERIHKAAEKKDSKNG
jgi:hypothetical protein